MDGLKHGIPNKMTIMFLLVALLLTHAGAQSTPEILRMVYRDAGGMTGTTLVDGTILRTITIVNGMVLNVMMRTKASNFTERLKQLISVTTI